MHCGRKTIDDDLATEMLRAGEPVSAVAHEFRVSVQSVYRAIRAGRLPDPVTAQPEAAAR